MSFSTPKLIQSKQLLEGQKLFSLLFHHKMHCKITSVHRVMHFNQILLPIFYGEIKRQDSQPKELAYLECYWLIQNNVSNSNSNTEGRSMWKN